MDGWMYGWKDEWMGGYMMYVCMMYGCMLFAFIYVCIDAGKYVCIL